MNKSSFQIAFLAILAGSLGGCASPMNLFAKKQQPFDEYVAQRKAEQARIAGSHNLPNSQADLSELLHQGHAAFQQGNLAEAQSKYFAIVQQQPNHPVANHRLGVIADRQQDYASAQRHYIAALNASPNDPNLLNDIGYSFLLQSRYPEAESYLQGALQKNPKQTNAINNLGLLYAKQGQPDRALAMFRMTNSEAEAQAKVARLTPSAANPMLQPGTMMANQAWPPQNPAMMNAAPIQSNPGIQNSFNAAPSNPAIAANGSQGYGNRIGNGQLGPNLSQVPNPNVPNNGWSSPDLTSPNGQSAIAQTSGIVDPNVPEETRRLKEKMEGIRLQAISERQNRDNAERQRNEMFKQQLRAEELSRANIVNPVYSSANRANQWNGQPSAAPPNANGPIVVGPPSSASTQNQNLWQATPDRQSPALGISEQLHFGQSPGMPNGAGSTPPVERPNVSYGSMPPSNAGSPLDTMPNWPPTGALPPIIPGNSTSTTGPSNSSLNNGNWSNGIPPGVTNDPSQTASRLGMSAGPGNPFPITPGPSPHATSAPSWPNSSHQLPNNGQYNGISPTTPADWPANSNLPNDGTRPGEPPAESFGPGNFSTSANSPSPLTMSPAPTAMRDRLPPSEQYQTPGSFNYLPAGSFQAQPTSYEGNRSTGGLTSSQFGTSNSPPSSRRADDSRWVNGQTPGTQSVQTSTPTTQGYLASPAGENSLLEYERWIQQQNEETNQIRQLIDAQRQLPPSENFRRVESPQR